MPQDEGMRPEGGEQLSEPLVDPRAPWEELVEDPNAPRKLLAVLFTDIVGSTELATALGDKRWRELLEQHDAAIRAQIARYGGREVDTAGDAFFATFELPVRAVDCALESARAVRRLGLRIRAGVHMGECVVSDGKVRGVSVHIGARVAAKARGDELLISSTVRDILAGAGLKFVDRGEQTLKGVEGRWRLYAVEPRERDKEADLPPLLEAEIAKPALPWWRRRRVVVAGLTALAVLIAAVAFAVARGGGLSSVPADSIAMIDAGSGSVVKSVSVRRRPVGLVAASDGVWVTNSIDRSVTHVKDDGTSETIRVEAGPIAVAAGRNLIWVANADGKSVSRISPDTGGVVGDAIQTGNGLSDIAYGAGAVWITNAVDGTVWRIDPASGKVTDKITVGPAVRGIAVTKDEVWVTSETAGTVTRLDPRSGTIVSVVRVGNGAGAVAIGARSVWVANAFDGTVSQVDPKSGSVRRTVRVGRGPRSLAVSGGHVFVANESDATVSMIETNGGVKTIGLQNAPMGLASDGDRVWVSVRGGISHYRGGTLHVGTSLNFAPFDPSVDPALGWNPLIIAITVSAYDGLTSFKKVGGVESSELVADLAEEIRAPTDGGKTYTFTLREGLKYSDGAPVRATDVRKTFERMFTLEAPAGLTFLPILVGSERCAPKKPCDLSAGVVTDDRARTVVFHLKTPLADFPYLLALPMLSILPSTTPPSDTKFSPIPGTGPYRVASAKGNDSGGEAVLERNRYFRSRGAAQPDGYPDRIEVRWNGKPAQHVQAVTKNSEDYTLDAQEPGIPTLQLATDFPAQVHLYDQPFVAFAGLNPHAPPFNDVRVRQALNLAIDRGAIVRELHETFGDVTCQILTKNVVGYAPYCPYTRSPNPSGIWTGPDIAKAETLVKRSGTAGQQVIIWIDSDPGETRGMVQRVVVPHFVSALKKIGFRPVVKTVPGFYYEALLDPRSRHQISLHGWSTDYPAASSFIVPLLICPDTFQRVTGAPPDKLFNPNHFCSHEIDAKVEHALALQREDVGSTRDEWAEVDRFYTDQAPWVPLASFHGAALVSRRVGNVLANAIYGPLLSQMWVVEAPRPSPS